MPKLHFSEDELATIKYCLKIIMAFAQDTRDLIDDAPRVEDAGPSDKPLAQGKPSKRSAKGNTSKAGKPPRKSAGKKRGR